MTSSKVTILLLLFVAASGCSRRGGSARDEMASQASFSVDPISTVGSAKGSSDSAWNLPNKRSINFKACIKDTATLNSVLGQTFVVSGGAAEQRRVSDPTGCISWNEEVGFNYLAPETYVTLERQIKGTSPQAGSITVPIAVNPWQDDAGVVDLRYNQIANVASGASVVARLQGSAMDPTGGAQLQVDSVGLYFEQARYSGKKTEIPMQLTMHPVAIRKTLDGTVTGVALTAGHFRLHVALLEKTPGKSGDDKIILSEKEWDLAMSGGVLTATASLELSHVPSLRAVYELHFRLIPLQAPVGLEPEDGMITFESIKGSGSAVVTRAGDKLDPLLKALAAAPKPSIVSESAAPAARPEPASPLKPDPGPRVINEPAALPSNSPSGSPAATATAAADPNNQDACGDHDRSGGYIFDSVQINHAGFTGFSPDQKSANEIMVNITACLKNSLDLSAIPAFPFSVGLVANQSDPIRQVRETDSNGCMHWNEPLKFEYTQMERWMPMYIKVESKTAPYSDVAKSFKVMINPWQVGWLHNWDCRSGTPPETLRTTPAKIGIVEVGLGFNGRDFSIDDRLRMTMLRKYRFQFRPLIVRNDLAHPTPTYDSVGDGKFKFRIALLMNRSDMSGADDPSARFITSYESVVEARNGIVVEEVPLKFLFRELPLIGTRSEVFMELAPLDAKNGLIATTWRAPVHIATDETMNTLEPTVLDIGKLIAEGQKMKAELDAKYDAGAETLKASRNAQSLLGVARLTNEDAKAIGLAKADVASLMVDAGNNPKLAAKFCPLFFDGTVEAPQGFGQKLVAVFRKPKSDLEKCQADPKTYLTVGRAKQIEKVVTQPREIRGDTFTMSMSATFSKNSSLSVYTGASLGLELPVFGAKMVEMESYLGARIDQTRTFMQNATTMRALMAEQIELEFEAQARDCLYVSGKGARDPKPTRFTCTQPEAKQETIRESWFMVTQIQDHSSTLLRDPRLLKERSWCKLVRGASLFQRFKDLVDDKNNYWILTPFTIKNDLNASGSAITSAAKQAFKGDFVIEDGNFPGLIIE